MLRTILRKYPMLNGVLFDQPSVIEKARGRFEQEGLNERCTFVPGDFFVSIPQGADAYLLKNIIIDWQDEQAISILRHCRQAMKPQSKLLIVETLFTPEGMLFEKLVNLQLLLSFGAGSGERTSEQFRQIFEAAGLKMTAIIPTGSQYSIFEAVPA